MQLITQRIIKKYYCFINKLLVYVHYVRTVFVMCCTVVFLFFKSLCHTVVRFLCLYIWGSEEHELQHWHCPCKHVACCALMLHVHTHCEVQMVHWHQMTFLKTDCRKVLKYIWICVQGYVFFNPLTRLFIVTSFNALKYVVTHSFW
jgi:hypothetical protein